MKSIELFAGIGGIALAAEWAGIETVAFCEREPYAQKVLKNHWPAVPIFDDVKTLNRKVLEEKGVFEPGGTVDIISGGFPCQPYSLAGKRKGKEDDRDLWPEMFRIIEEIRPTWVVGENVANFVNMELDRTLSDLESIGYKGQSFVIPACAVDAKHRRDRTFVVAYSNSERFQKKRAEQQTAGIAGKSEVIPNTDSAGLEGENRAKLESSNPSGCCSMADPENQGDVRRYWGISNDDGSSEKRNYQRRGTETNDGRQRWSIEPDVGRVVNGVPNRVDRIKGLGNAVVPQQIYPIFKYIKQIHDMETQE